MIRFAVGDEDPRDLLTHFIHAARLTLDPAVPGFSRRFPSPEEATRLIRECYIETHRKYIESKEDDWLGTDTSKWS
jgi:hypothetical protein